MREQTNELWQIVSIRPFGDQPKGIEHVTYKSTKESADEYVEWLGAEQYNRGKVKSVTQYLRAGSELTPSMSRETALGHLNQFLVREGHLSDSIKYPEEVKYARWTQMFGNTAGPFKSGLCGQMCTQFLMEAWHWDNFAVVFCNGKVVKCTDNFYVTVEY